MTGHDPQMLKGVLSMLLRLVGDAEDYGYFASCGITVRPVLTDNGACYRSFDFRDAPAGIVHKRTRPYRRATNGKVERFHRTLVEESAYAAPTPATPNAKTSIGLATPP